MKRDMLCTARQAIGKIPTVYDLTADELRLLEEIARKPNANGLWDAIGIAFRYGFILGTRHEKTLAKKRPGQSIAESYTNASI